MTSMWCFSARDSMTLYFAAHRSQVLSLDFSFPRLMYSLRYLEGGQRVCRLPCSSTWITIQLYNNSTKLHENVKKSYCNVLCYSDEHTQIQKYTYNYLRNLILIHIDWLNKTILFILNIFYRATLYVARTEYAVAVCPSVLSVTCW